MGVKDNLKVPKKKFSYGRIIVVAPVGLAVLFGIAIALMMAALLLRGSHGMDAPSVPSGSGLPIGGMGVVAVLLGAILFLLVGIFLAILLSLCCKCGCGGGDEKSILGLLAAFFPGVAAGLRAGAKGFDATAAVAHAATDPLHTTGKALHDTLGPALVQIEVPSASLPNRLLWDVLHDLHLVHGQAPDFMNSLWVLTGVELATQTPFGGPDGLGTQLTDAGARLNQAGDGAAELETVSRAAAGELRTVASMIDGQP